MLDLEPYLVEFYFKKNVKDKVYLDHYQFRNMNCKPVIIITHDEYIFFANSGKTHRW